MIGMRTPKHTRKMEQAPDSSVAGFMPDISAAMGIENPNAEDELKRAVDGLHAMNIEDEIFSSLDGALTVFKGRKKDSLVYVQVKRITKQGGEHYMRGICNEIGILTQLQGITTHARISTLLDCYQTQRHVWIISEFIGGNCLRDILVHTCLGATAVRALCSDMAQAMLFLHTECKLVHADLRPANIWFTESGMVKLCGFAFAHDVNNTDEVNDALTQHHISNAEYAPPEMLATKQRYCRESDVWMFGITLYESVHGVTPFTGTSYFHVCDRVLEDQPLFSTACTLQVVQLTKLLLHKGANQRPTGKALVEAVKHI